MGCASAKSQSPPGVPSAERKHQDSGVVNFNGDGVPAAAEKLTASNVALHDAKVSLSTASSMSQERDSVCEPYGPLALATPGMRDESEYASQWQQEDMAALDAALDEALGGARDDLLGSTGSGESESIDVSEDVPLELPKVTIVAARGLSVSPFASPYCVVEIEERPESRRQTPALPSSSSSVAWNYTMEVMGYNLGDAITFSVIDNGPSTKTQVLGRGTLSETLVREGFAGELQLYGANERAEAFLDVRVSAADPTLLQRVEATAIKAAQLINLAKEVAEEAAEEGAEIKEGIAQVVGDNFFHHTPRGATDVVIEDDAPSSWCKRCTCT